MHYALFCVTPYWPVLLLLLLRFASIFSALAAVWNAVSVHSKEAEIEEDLVWCHTVTTAGLISQIIAFIPFLIV